MVPKSLSLGLGVIIFGLVQFLPIKTNQTDIFLKKPKPN